jgi:ADP-ribose pyrophosphatase YjhB (NUDIX family)
VGFPHPTIDIPGEHLSIAVELQSLLHHNELSRLLIRGLGQDKEQFGDIPVGHLCATAWVMTPERDHILLVQHELLGWSAPGGHMYPHETTQQAALRELEEETGLTPDQVTTPRNVPAIIHASDVNGDRPHRHWNVSWLLYSAMDFPLTSDHGARWWPCDELPTGSETTAPADLAPTVAIFRSLTFSSTELD